MCHSGATVGIAKELGDVDSGAIIKGRDSTDDRQPADMGRQPEWPRMLAETILLTTITSTQGAVREREFASHDERNGPVWTVAWTGQEAHLEPDASRRHRRGWRQRPAGW